MLPEIFRDEVFRLETQHLWLRWPRPADAVDVDRFASLEPVASMTATWPHPLPEGESLQRIWRGRDMTEAGRGLSYAMALRGAPATVIGLIGGTLDDDGRTLGIGYMLHPQHWRRGFASQAMAAVIDMVFLVSAVSRITAGARADNPASCRVLVKSGLREIGRELITPPARPATQEEVVRYELSRAGWSQRRKAARAGRHAGGEAVP